jgi:dolichyl-phosphate beta-glucosyltransferase
VLAEKAGDIERRGFHPELLYLARKLRLSMLEVPVAWSHQQGTRINRSHDGIRMFGEVLRIRWNALSGKYSTNPPVAEVL